MQSEQVLEIMREALKVAVMLCGPMLVAGLFIGVTVNVFQAVTQISETTLQVVPKIIAMLIALVIFAPWMTDLLTDFTVQLFESIPNVIR